ncbi:MAG: tetratricopeptide repeat protein [Desulfofustis sp. PB-SRB1]|nr:tetratricopeptide repeat protein [Desulfofustis sp. PB-SRB1]MBM1001093.1 tetratricopeptide repeat protein [Desulfofustis sp. PB-SRB1]HBH30180.1 hypothetical protein [Desulfofustis sp.]
MSEKTTLKWHGAGLIAAVICLLAPLLYLMRDSYAIKPVVAGELEFTGSESCKSCHRAVYDKWHNSHHDLAMDVAAEETVLGDFSDVTFTDSYSGATSRFFRNGGKFFVETEGVEGTPVTYEITHTFGVYPLQQYLIPFPGGRLQCLNIGWNSRENRWYRLPPYEVEGPDDWLHWTRGGQTWNGMCAECHSTRLEKGYDMATETYDTRWFEIHVGCEACHGPGSRHISWAERPEMARPKAVNYDLAVQLDATDPGNRRQIAVCAPCHSRRYQLGDNLHREGELLDTIVPSLLSEGLYYPDGQIYEEVYVYGSYTQSKMYQHGVRCSDCHDSHSLQRHHEGNELCLQCHRAQTYDTPTHHFHKREHNGEPSEGHLCVKCHMPGRIYMGADYRPDHSLRIPRPDLSEKIGVPNSCSAAACHADKSLDWVNEHYVKWYGSARKPHYGEVFARGRNQIPEAVEELMNTAEDGLLPPIVRATALSLLSTYPHEITSDVFIRALEDGEALIRHSAVRNLAHLDIESRRKLLEPKLYDDVKAVRIEAAALLADVDPESIRPEHRQALARVLEEYRDAMVYNSDFAPQRYNLGNLAAATGKPDDAIRLYREALLIDDRFYQAKINLAFLLNQNGDNPGAAELFSQVLAENPDLPEVAYSFGLLLAEMEQYEQSAFWLGEAADRMPHHSRARYNQALALLKLQQWENGEKALLQALDQEPGNQEYFTTLANLYLNFGLIDRAELLGRRTLAIDPSHNRARELLESLPK